MTTATVILLVLFACGASFVQRVSGFGFGIFIMTILPHLMPTYGEATALSGMLAIVTSCITAVKMARFTPWKKLLPLLTVFIIVSFFFVKMVSRVDSAYLKHFIGYILVAVSIYFFFISERISMKPTLPVQISMGALSGVMGGLFAMQGPPAVIYFIASCKDKNEYIAITQWFFLIGNIMMTVYRASNGFVTPLVCKSWLIGVPAILLGLALGSRVFGYISIKLLRKLVYAYIAVAGIIAIIY